ncbi:helix-turn-helix domain-containing protein [Streptomyces nitrosporeus]|uniref:helix-turn-helix domain-containing protein n=1 Tax=Streptomyces nitrosporeus TaxID=28894 RepID=UPI0039A05DB4
MDNDDSRRMLDPGGDPAALKALTHPLRLRLLGLLRQHGPATASELAATTGESSASTSYHLRVLAKHAFVQEAEHRDGRERRWKAVHSVTSWSNEAVMALPGGEETLGFFRRRQLEHLGNSLERHQADIASARLGREWHETSGIDDLMPRLTPESVGELWETVRSKIAELTDRDRARPGTEHVVLVVAALPLAGGGPAAPGPDEPDTGAPEPGPVPAPAPGPAGEGRR